MERLLTGLSDEWPADSALGQLCANWSGYIGANGASLPLRIASGLHALVLTGRDAALSHVYPPNTASDAALISAALSGLHRHQDFMLQWVQNPPQTNEVRRSAALVPAVHWIAHRHPQPLFLSELGASAGLNLGWDRYAVRSNTYTLALPEPALTLEPEWTGPAPPMAQISVSDRRGVDLNPLNPHDAEQALHLFAYLWPDQPHRNKLTRAAITGLDAPVDQGDAIDWLEHRLTQVPDQHVHLIYHTIAWQYFPADVQRRGTSLIQAAGEKATDTAPLVWLQMESDGNAPGAALTVRSWPGDQHTMLARVDYHGRWVQWLAT